MSAATSPNGTDQRARSAAAIDAANADQRAALTVYLPIGFPTLPGSIEAVKTAIAAGADIIELGIPYSDPVMDGPIIQAATAKALSDGVRPRDVFTVIEACAGLGAPILVMTYWNLVHRHGIEQFGRDLVNAGGAGLITPDLVPDEASEWIRVSDELDLDRVFLAAPTSTAERLALVSETSRGFVYAASTMGVTGLRDSMGAAARDLVERTRAAGAQRVCVGIGVSNADQAHEVAQYADGVIVGSALVKALDESMDALARLTADLAAGVRRRHA